MHGARTWQVLPGGLQQVDDSRRRVAEGAPRVEQWCRRVCCTDLRDLQAAIAVRLVSGCVRLQAPWRPCMRLRIRPVHNCASRSLTELLHTGSLWQAQLCTVYICSCRILLDVSVHSCICTYMQGRRMLCAG